MYLFFRATWALAIYRQTIEAGALPTVETLSQLLGCLRKPEEPTKAVTSFDDRTMMAFLGQPQQAITSTGYDGFSIYDPRALSLFEVRSRSTFLQEGMIQLLVTSNEEFALNLEKALKE